MEKVIEATCSEAIQNLSDDPKYLSLALALALALLFFPPPACFLWKLVARAFKVCD